MNREVNERLLQFAINIKYWRYQLIIMSMSVTVVTILTAVEMIPSVAAYLLSTMLCWLSLVWPLSFLHYACVIACSVGCVIESIVFIMSVYRGEPHPVVRFLMRGISTTALIFAAFVSNKVHRYMCALERMESQLREREEHNRQLARVRRMLEAQASA